MVISICVATDALISRIPRVASGQCAGPRGAAQGLRAADGEVWGAGVAGAPGGWGSGQWQSQGFKWQLFKTLAPIAI